ncbi:hypothetical protein CROQUDRAFT_90073 [Cronartium quercuum f. sp. fusiforme G11]|uniref:Uncharacterized protein n=1 Tax=Cronartium quercuum f. sp. fusiforme G11 TaxID=708437 RepID=A0A9P6NS52_9BASI|nr:hypothetical protein CROQUDRAFT_90073 [Cronartium quercuum f. sp. fusiforme G11]
MALDKSTSFMTTKGRDFTCGLWFSVSVVQTLATPEQISIDVNMLMRRDANKEVPIAVDGDVDRSLCVHLDFQVDCGLWTAT